MPVHAYDPGRDQYDARVVLDTLREHRTVRATAIMGVTSADLYVPVLTYVYGAAQLGGFCAMVSLHRLRCGFYGMPREPEVFVARAEKTALHELGHSMGLTHCRNRRCAMYSSVCIEDTDGKDAAFCPTCAELMGWRRLGTMPNFR